ATFPSNTGQYPFYNEALNIEVQIQGAVNENMPAESSEAQSWVNHTWVVNPNYDAGADFQETNQPPFRPNIKYSYDADLRRMIRVRFTRPYSVGGVLRTEEVVWVAPIGPGLPVVPPGMRTLQAARAEALANGSYLQTLPLMPSLPTSALLYEGNPL
ncbi:MAG TPA: hypothetical protein VFU47_00260, partial [Armatimonadota bacterium]|nr:hypothetical protein [Armatimonadota bacterium]